MRLRKPLDSRNVRVPHTRTPAIIGTARFPVIHGPMRAAPLWHARIGRWVTGLAIAPSAPSVHPFTGGLAYRSAESRPAQRHESATRCSNRSSHYGVPAVHWELGNDAHSYGRSLCRWTLPAQHACPHMAQADRGQIDLPARERQLSGNPKYSLVWLHPANCRHSRNFPKAAVELEPTPESGRSWRLPCFWAERQDRGQCGH